MNQVQGIPIEAIDMDLYHHNMDMFRLINNLIK
jgi:hypothetical protein